MTQPDSNQNETSKMKKLINGNTEAVTSRLPRASGPVASGAPKKPQPVQKSSTLSSPALESKPRRKFMEAVWTIASIISLTVNIVIVIALLIVLQMLGGPKATFSLAQDEASGCLLYTSPSPRD